MGGLLLNVLFPLYLLIGFGFLIGKLKKDVETKSISFLVLFIFAPALIISSFRKIDLTYSDFSCTLLSAVFVVLSVWFLTFLYEQWVLKERLPALELSSTIMNSGYLGIPLIYLLFGNEGLPYGISFMIVMTVIHFTYGIFILKRDLKTGIEEILKLPVIYAIILAFFLKDLKFPDGLERMLELTGNATMPIMLVAIGISISRIKLSSLKLGFTSSSFRLLGGLIFSTLAVLVLSCNDLLSKVIVVQSSLPPAILNFVLCDRFGENPDIAASSILIGTFISPVWIAVTVGFLSWLY